MPSALKLKSFLSMGNILPLWDTDHSFRSIFTKNTRTVPCPKRDICRRHSSRKPRSLRSSLPKQWPRFFIINSVNPLVIQSLFDALAIYPPLVDYRLHIVGDPALEMQRLPVTGCTKPKVRACRHCRGQREKQL